MNNELEILSNQSTIIVLKNYKQRIFRGGSEGNKGRTIKTLTYRRT